MKTPAHFFTGLLVFCLLLELTYALENTIYISFDSQAGHFPDSTYQLNQYQVTLKNDCILIDGKLIFNAKGKKLIEIFLTNNSIYLMTDSSTKLFPVYVNKLTELNVEYC